MIGALGLAAAGVCLAGVLYWPRIMERHYLRALASPEIEVRKRAAEELGRRGSTRAVPYFLKALDQMGRAVPWTFTNHDGQLEFSIRPAEIETFSRRPGVDPDLLSLAHVIYDSLLNIARDPGEDLVHHLVAGLGCENEKVRCLCAFLLARLGPEAEPAVEALSETLYRDRDGLVHDFSAMALGHIGDAAVPTLKKAVDDFPFPSVVSTALRVAEDRSK